MTRTAMQYIAEYMVRAGTPYAVGIPGHGIWQLLDALYDHQDRVKVIPVMHEQSAVHVADAHFRASGVPLVSFTSIGPGATNTIVGMATAFVDSSAALLITGGPHTYLKGRSVLQELDRAHWSDFPRVAEGISKRHWEITDASQVPFVMDRAYSAMLSGRPWARPRGDRHGRAGRRPGGRPARGLRATSVGEGPPRSRADPEGR